MSTLGTNHAMLYGHGSTDELDRLESDLKAGKENRALFAKFPPDPLLTIGGSSSPT